MPDGRYNIMLQGWTMFRVLSEEQSADRSYRVARVTALPETINSEQRHSLAKQRRLLEGLLAGPLKSSGLDSDFPPTMPDEELVNGLSQHLKLEPSARQRLLESDGVVSRSEALIELLKQGAVVP